MSNSWLLIWYCRQIVNSPSFLKELDKTLTRWERTMNCEKIEVMKVRKERGHWKLELVEVLKYMRE